MPKHTNEEPDNLSQLKTDFEYFIKLGQYATATNLLKYNTSLGNKTVLNNLFNVAKSKTGNFKLNIAWKNLVQQVYNNLNKNEQSDFTQEISTYEINTPINLPLLLDERIQEIETSINKEEPPSFLLWLKHKYGVIDLNENTNQDPGIREGCFINFIFRNEAQLEDFKNEFHPEKLPTRSLDEDVKFEDNISKKTAIVINEKIFENIEQAYNKFIQKNYGYRSPIEIRKQIDEIKAVEIKNPLSNEFSSLENLQILANNTKVKVKGTSGETSQKATIDMDIGLRKFHRETSHLRNKKENDELLDCIRSLKPDNDTDSGLIQDTLFIDSVVRSNDGTFDPPDVLKKVVENANHLINGTNDKNIYDTSRRKKKSVAIPPFFPPTMNVNSKLPELILESGGGKHHRTVTSYWLRGMNKEMQIAKEGEQIAYYEAYRTVFNAGQGSGWYKDPTYNKKTKRKTTGITYTVTTHLLKPVMTYPTAAGAGTVPIEQYNSQTDSKTWSRTAIDPIKEPIKYNTYLRDTLIQSIITDRMIMRYNRNSQNQLEYTTWSNWDTLSFKFLGILQMAYSKIGPPQTSGNCTMMSPLWYIDMRIGLTSQLFWFYIKRKSFLNISSSEIINRLRADELGSQQQFLEIEELSKNFLDLIKNKKWFTAKALLEVNTYLSSIIYENGPALLLIIRKLAENPQLLNDNNLKKLISFLLENINYNINAIDDFGNTALHYIFQIKNEDSILNEWIKMLLEKGATFKMLTLKSEKNELAKGITKIQDTFWDYLEKCDLNSIIRTVDKNPWLLTCLRDDKSTPLVYIMKLIRNKLTKENELIIKDGAKINVVKNKYELLKYPLKNQFILSNTTTRPLLCYINNEGRYIDIKAPWYIIENFCNLVLGSKKQPDDSYHISKNDFKQSILDKEINISEPDIKLIDILDYLEKKASERDDVLDILNTEDTNNKTALDYARDNNLKIVDKLYINTRNKKSTPAKVVENNITLKDLLNLLNNNQLDLKQINKHIQSNIVNEIISNNYSATPLQYVLYLAHKTSDEVKKQQYILIANTMIDKMSIDALNHQNYKGNTALHLASFYSFPTVLTTLLDKKVCLTSLNKNDEKPFDFYQHETFMAIIKRGNIEEINSCLPCKPALTITDDSFLKATVKLLQIPTIDIAMTKEYLNKNISFLSHIFSEADGTNLQCTTLLQVLMYYIKNTIDNNDHNSCQRLISIANDIQMKMTAELLNHQNKNGQTALHLAICWNIPDLTKTLLTNNQINVNQPDSNGLTPLMHAVSNNPSNPEVVKSLLKQGADVAAKSKKHLTVFKIAKNPEIIKLLKSHKKILLEELSSEAKNADRNKILDLFAEVKKRDGKYKNLHLLSNPKWDHFRLGFMSKRNGENFWHTDSYQQAVGLLKNAYINSATTVANDRKGEADQLIDYIRGNKPIHIGKTATRKKMGSTS